MRRAFGSWELFCTTDRFRFRKGFTKDSNSRFAAAASAYAPVPTSPPGDPWPELHLSRFNGALEVRPERPLLLLTSLKSAFGSLLAWTLMRHAAGQVTAGAVLALKVNAMHRTTLPRRRPSMRRDGHSGRFLCPHRFRKGMV